MSQRSQTLASFFHPEKQAVQPWHVIKVAAWHIFKPRSSIGSDAACDDVIFMVSWQPEFRWTNTINKICIDYRIYIMIISNFIVQSPIWQVFHLHMVSVSAAQGMIEVPKQLLMTNPESHWPIYDAMGHVSVHIAYNLWWSRCRRGVLYPQRIHLTAHPTTEGGNWRPFRFVCCLSFGRLIGTGKKEYKL